MDQRIKNLASTTFGGRRFTRNQIALVQETVQQFPALSRRELAHTICEHLGWHTPNGENKAQACLGMLETLEGLGLFSLPAKDQSKQRGAQKRLGWTDQTDEQPTIDEELKQLAPLRLQVASEKDDIQLWNEYVDRHHYLGYKRPIGAHLRYFMMDAQGRKLGCLLFSYAVQRLPCRDEWIGWQAQSHKKHLDLVVNNNRFLIFPWVQVKNLASKALSIAARQLPEDWQAHHGYKPVLLETFVDPTKFNATCYRAANWHYLGQTQGRANTRHSLGKTQKSVYVYPLVRNAKSILINGPERPAKKYKQPSISAPKPLTSADPFIQLWQNIIGTITTVANEFDRQWQKRQRVLNTLLIMLFIFRLVFSRNRQGYAITIAELWDQCRTLNIPLPQATPVAASAFCNARAKLDENIFKTLQQEILRRYNRSVQDDLWQAHRIYAVDGSKINLPRPLINDGYQTPSVHAHYPQGLLSCLYQLKTKIPVDFELAAHANERTLALKHLALLSENDVVVYDRGYFSYALLYEHQKRGIYPLFRLKSKANQAIDNFTTGNKTDQVIQIVPGRKSKTALRKQYPDARFEPITLRVVKYTIADTTYILGTTLLNPQLYTINALSTVYHARWGVEELYKISKQLMTIEDFHGQSERGVKQELYAHFVLITLTRIFSNHSEDGFNLKSGAEETPIIKANFKNSLMTVARHIESLLLRQAKLVTDAINQIVASIASVRQKLRPNRSYDRRSRKPIGKWRAPKPA